jgi:hypothetical protein
MHAVRYLLQQAFRCAAEQSGAAVRSRSGRTHPPTQLRAPHIVWQPAAALTHQAQPTQAPQGGAPPQLTHLLD